MTQANDSPSTNGGDGNGENIESYYGRVASGAYDGYCIDTESTVSLNQFDDIDWPEVYERATLEEARFGHFPETEAFREYVDADGGEWQPTAIREWLAYWAENEGTEIALDGLREEWPWLYDSLLESPLAALNDAELALRYARDDYRAGVTLAELPDDLVRTIESLRSRDKGRLVAIDVLIDTRSKKDDECYLVTGTCDVQSCNEQNPVWQDRFATSVNDPEDCRGHKSQTAIADVERHYYTKQELLVKDLPSRVGHTNTEQVTAEVNTNHVHEFEAGERVRIAAVVRRDTSNGEKRAQHYLQVVGYDRGDERFDEVEVNDEERQRIQQLSEETDIVDRLAESIAPEIKGGDEYTLARKAILHQLAGAPLRPPLDETNLGDEHTRGAIHIALAGDPSTGKTRLARRANAIFPNSRYVDMESTSAVGLKGSVQRVEEFDTNRWTVSTGALASANRGIVVADELDKAHVDDAKALNVPMSNGVVNIDKADIHTKLEARTSILAVCNPKKERFDKHSELIEQIPIPPALWTRFDVVVPFEDDPLDSEANRQKASRFANRVSNGSGPEFGEEFIRKYITLAREHDPELTQSAAKHLEQVWIELREESSRDTVSVTTRHQDAIHRLAQASARLRLSEEVEVQDVRRGNDIVEASLRMISEDDELDADRLTAGPSARQREMIEVAEKLVVEALSLASTNAVDEQQIWAVAKSELGDDWTRTEVVEALDLAVQNNVLWYNQAGYGVVDDG